MNLAARLIRSDETAVHPAASTGVKITFCFVDVVFTGITGPNPEITVLDHSPCFGSQRGVGGHP